MRAEKDSFKRAIEFGEEVNEAGRPVIVAKIVVQCPEFEQNEQLPNRIETQVLATGQELMQKYYRVLMELADRELVLADRAGKNGAGIQRIGTRTYKFKTSFGTVAMKRIRIKHKADDSTEIPSVRAWGLPKRLCITSGLRAAVCNLVVRQSFASTVRQLEAQTGEAKLLSKSSVGKILKAAGKGLSEANEQRARAVYQADDGVKRLLGRAESYIAEDWFEDVYLKGKEITEEELPDLFDEIEWDPRQLPPIDNASVEAASTALDGEVETSQERSASQAEIITVEPDEVVVASQRAGRKWEINYSAVVSRAKQSHYFTAATSAGLWYQVASLLSELKVEANQLLLLSDGAPWVRYWFEGLGITYKESIMCWFHLQQRCWRGVREAIKNKDDRLAIYRALMKHLWCGQVAESRAYLKELITAGEDSESKISLVDLEALEKLRQYLFNRREHIPDYLKRMRAGERIANTKVEKFNDCSVSTRCKKQNGMRWTSAGVSAIAALEAARRNSELEIWRQSGQMPSWEQVLQDAA